MGTSASRERFKHQLVTLTTATDGDLPPLPANFYDDFWKTPSSAEEVFSVLDPETVRLLRDTRFDNLTQLFTQACAQMCQIVETPYGIYFDQALNCVRVLTRFMPFILEAEVGEDYNDTEMKTDIERLCWAGDASVAERERDRASTVIASRDGANDDESTVESVIALNEEQESLGLLVIHASLHMLFLPQFTIDMYDEKEVPGDEGSVATATTVSDVNASPDDETNNTTDDDGNVTTNKGNGNEKEHNANVAPPPPPPPPTSPRSSILRRRSSVGSSSSDSDYDPLEPSPNGIIWTAGATVYIEDLYSYGSTKLYDKNRVEVLRLLLSACSGALFRKGENERELTPADEDAPPSSPGVSSSSSSPSSSSSSTTTRRISYSTPTSRWLQCAVAADAPNAAALFYSLLNTVLSHSFNNTAGLPYASRGMSHVQELSIQLLCVFLYEEESSYNVYRQILVGMTEERDLKFCWRGFTHLLNNTYGANNTYLPGSVAKIHCHQEVLILFWKFIEENKSFCSYIMGDGADILADKSVGIPSRSKKMKDKTTPNINEIVVPICYLLLDAKDDPSKIGLVHICTFILLKLSGERSFGVALNEPFLQRLPTDIPRFSGSHHDLVAITLHKLLIQNDAKIKSLTSCFLTIIGNISPYWKSISLTASVKLVNLFEIMTSDKRMFSVGAAENVNHLALLVEVFNNAIQYQFSGNQQLIYTMIRRRRLFDVLNEISIEGAIGRWQTLKTLTPNSKMRVGPTDGVGGKPTDEWLAGLKR